MTTDPENAPDVLDRLWDDITPADPPIADLLSAGHTATRRKHRTVLAGAAALGLIAIGGAWLATGGLASSGNDPTVADPGARELTVQVEGGMSQQLQALFGGVTPNRDAAVWDPTEQNLVYATGFDYSGSCPPTATARLTDTDAVVLVVEPYQGAGACTADATRYTVTVGGLSEAPTEVTVEALGTTGVVGVQNAPANAALFALDCGADANYASMMIDYFLDADAPGGSATPLQAIQKMLAGDESAVVSEPDPLTGTVRVALLRADGTTRVVARVMTVNGGWRTESTESCSGEGVNPSRRDR